MALKEKTREEDKRLREELKNADIKKFKVAIKPLLSHPKEGKSTPDKK